MIIIGYQGIGKSTTAKVSKDFIDLESGNFWVIGDDGRILRDPDWYKSYCNIALDLSKQGYNVFVSSHKQVRDYIRNATSDYVAIVPAMHLEDKWIFKLWDRYNASQLDKDFKAYANAADRYKENINEIMEDCKDHCIQIQTMDYKLIRMIEEYITNLHIY